MTPNDTNPTSSSADREVVTTRVFPASCAQVFEAFSDPNRLAQWWGPKGFTNTFREFDFRPGGRWRFVMHGPDGTDYPNEKTFVEVVPPARIVFLHRMSPHHFRMTMTFVPEGHRTRLTWRMLFESEAEFSPIKNFITSANEQNFDRLAAHLAGTT